MTVLSVHTLGSCEIYEPKNYLLISEFYTLNPSVQLPPHPLSVQPPSYPNPLSVQPSKIHLRGPNVELIVELWYDEEGAPAPQLLGLEHVPKDVVSHVQHVPTKQK